MLFDHLHIPIRGRNSWHAWFVLGECLTRFRTHRLMKTGLSQKQGERRAINQGAADLFRWRIAVIRLIVGEYSKVAKHRQNYSDLMVCLLTESRPMPDAYKQKMTLVSVFDPTSAHWSLPLLMNEVMISTIRPWLSWILYWMISPPVKPAFIASKLGITGEHLPLGKIFFKE